MPSSAVDGTFKSQQVGDVGNTAIRRAMQTGHKELKKTRAGKY
jgi:hypothetical protein